MLNVTIDLSYAVRALRNIAQAEPTRVGQADSGSCVYATNKNGALVPVCIVGQWLANEGLLRFLLNDPDQSVLDWQKEPYGAEFPKNLDACMAQSAFWDRLESIGFHVEPEAQKFLHAVQRQQDDGLGWGLAFAKGANEYRASVLSAAEVALNAVIPEQDVDEDFGDF